MSLPGWSARGSPNQTRNTVMCLDNQRGTLQAQVSDSIFGNYYLCMFAPTQAKQMLILWSGRGFERRKHSADKNSWVAPPRPHQWPDRQGFSIDKVRVPCTPVAPRHLTGSTPCMWPEFKGTVPSHSAVQPCLCTVRTHLLLISLGSILALPTHTHHYHLSIFKRSPAAGCILVPKSNRTRLFASGSVCEIDLQATIDRLHLFAQRPARPIFYNFH
jgi:hypothetical protein